MGWVDSLRGSIAEEAARLRSIYPLRTPDSIQMATAIQMNATYFLTNDKAFPSLSTLKVLKLEKLKLDQNI